MENKLYPPIHPGEILLEEFLIPMNITSARLAQAIKVPQNHIEEIIQGKRPITPTIGIKISRIFGMSDSFWTGLQMDYDLEVIRDENAAELSKLQLIAV